ncbi:MAG: nicotinamide-nucleotide amidohydrolase family protein [Acidimicrobiaceae bacterium]|nr:nicotinamide-nucleotide amidohydrolase family protein [Acidimicrobiaceae bacterium]
MAVGTELLLGQIVDTNSSWIGEQLALAGIDSHFQTKVGDNLGRMTAAIEQALERSDAVIVCGGLGPTPDDITRDAIAAVMGVELRRDEAVVERIRSMFYRRDRQMPANNLQQADVPVGARVMAVQPGTAPGLICPLRPGASSDGMALGGAPLGGAESGGTEPGKADAGAEKVIYAVPGVPWEMKRMVSECVVPDLQARAGERHVIRSRTLRTWGHSESGLAELLEPEMRLLDSTGKATIAFLASGMEGLKVRITAKAADDETAETVLSGVESRARAVIGEAVFGVDDDTMESVVLDMMRSQGLTLGLAESVTGGLIAARLTEVPGASDVLRGAVVPYDRSLKTAVLGAPDVNAVSSEMALAMAEGACRVLGADVGLATTGAAGPDPHEGAEAGTVWIGLHLDGEGDAVRVRFNMARTMVRQLGTITALNLLRTRLPARDG